VSTETVNASAVPTSTELLQPDVRAGAHEPKQKPPSQITNVPVKSTKDEERPQERRVSFSRSNGHLVETVVSPTGFFQFWEEGGDQPVKTVRDGEAEYVPNSSLRKFWEANVVQFPSHPRDYGTTSELLGAVKLFILRYADLPHDWLDIVCLYVLMTWVYERFTALPYLRFLGEPATGKTRLLQVTSSICYKGTVVSGNITGAALFRTIDLIQGTIAVDEADFKSSAEWSDITKILNNGYAAGTPVIRCNRDSFDPECFVVFGPKVISTRNRFDDEATETRCLTLETKEQRVSSHIPFQLPPCFKQEALELQNKLLKWRFDNFHKTSAKEDGLRDLFARSGQIGASLAAVAPDEEWRNKLLGFLTRMETDRNEESPKGMVQRAIKAMSSGLRVTAKVSEVAEMVNSERKGLGLECLSDKRVGGILRSLGFSPKRKSMGYVLVLKPDEPSG
jgi:hypothetical protein